MSTLGETLRQARLDKRVSLDIAADETRIRRSYIEALENDDAAALPAPVYTRGFVRTYAEFLGLNPQTMADLYQPTRRRDRTVPPLRAALPHMPIPRQVPVKPLLYVLSGIIALVLAVFLWNLYQTLREAAQAGDVVGPVRPGSPTVVVRQPTIPPFLLASPVPTPSPTPTPEPTPLPSPTPEIQGILVVITATAPVYVEASVDGKAVLAETLPAGTSRTLPLGQTTVIVRVSNPSLAQITVNGQPQPQATGTTPSEYTWNR